MPCTSRRVSLLTRMLNATSLTNVYDRQGRALGCAVLFDDVVQYAHAEFQVADGYPLVMCVDAVIFFDGRKRRREAKHLCAQFDLEARVGAAGHEERHGHTVAMLAYPFVHQVP